VSSSRGRHDAGRATAYRGRLAVTYSAVQQIARSCGDFIPAQVSDQPGERVRAASVADRWRYLHHRGVMP
jgi:hypothetical protein